MDMCTGCQLFKKLLPNIPASDESYCISREVSSWNRQQPCSRSSTSLAKRIVFAELLRKQKPRIVRLTCLPWRDRVDGDVIAAPAQSHKVVQ